MTRLSNDNSDVDNKVGHPKSGTHAAGGGAVKGTGPDAAGKDAFARQANKGILADAVAAELNVPRRTAARVLDAVLDAVQELLRSRGKVAVKGFGTFERKIRKGRAYKHPLSGKSIEVADKETILFKPSDQLIVSTRTGTGPRPAKKKITPPDDILFQG
ncbi:MAG: HU family DNA-binding protein [Planctomycetes bacterium]|nr:HU family DNA-binding protein [Planctomycetota bacterium]